MKQLEKCKQHNIVNITNVKCSCNKIIPISFCSKCDYCKEEICSVCQNKSPVTSTPKELESFEKNPEGAVVLDTLEEAEAFFDKITK